MSNNERACESNEEAAERWLTPGEVASSFRVDEATVLELIASGKLRAVAVGSHFRISQRAIREYSGAHPARRTGVRRVASAILGSILALAAVGVFGSRVVLAGSDDSVSATTIPYDGYLVLDGKPVDGERYVTFTLYQSDGTKTSWTESHLVTVTQGRFRADLGATTPIDPVLSQSPDSLALEIAVDDAVDGEPAGDPVPLTPRQRFGAVPYAYRNVPGTDFVVSGRLTDPAGIALTIPRGAIIPFNLSTCPEGWSPYAPARGRTILGLGGIAAGVVTTTPITQSADMLGGLGGADRHTLTVAEMPSHSHQLVTVPDSDKGGGYSGGGWFGDPTPVTTNTVGGDQPHNNMPPFVALLYCVKD